MGALHAGHLSLVAASRARDGATAATIFVNPLQFGPREDFGRYPRALEKDLELLAPSGVDCVFAPTAGALYPTGFATILEVAGLSERLCGASRPGHFRGVATVVLKLLLLAGPKRAYFGQKDAAQLAVIRRMTRDLGLGIEIVAAPIVRAEDGLALSSRNAYLTAEERRQATGIHRALATIARQFQSGERDAAKLVAAGRGVLEEAPLGRWDYFAAVEADTLLPVTTAGPNTLFAAAAFFGETRLIDNLLINAAGEPQL